VKGHQEGILQGIYSEAIQTQLIKETLIMNISDIIVCLFILIYSVKLLSFRDYPDLA
jgi:hypothetical protein